MLKEIIMFFTWPVIIWFSYKMTRVALKKFEKVEEASQE